MIGTSATYLLLQGPGVFYAGSDQTVIAQKESIWALLGMFLCFGLFSWYLYYQIQVSQSRDMSTLLRCSRSHSMLGI